MCRINKSKKKALSHLVKSPPPHNISLVTKSGKPGATQKFKGMEDRQGDILESAVKVYKTMLISPGK